MEQKPCPLNEAQWVQYLQAFIVTNVMLSPAFLAAIMAYFAISINLFVIIKPNTLLTSVIYLTYAIISPLMVIFILLYFWYKLKMTQGFNKELQELIDKIICGNIMSNDIRDEWKKLVQKYYKIKRNL